ncbi:hypothetical protein ACJW31_03G070300 [Castanea mollissima]
MERANSYTSTALQIKKKFHFPMPLLLGFQDSTMSMVHGPVSATPAYTESQTQYTSRVQVESRASLGYTSHHESLDSLPHAQVSATPYTSKFKSKPKSNPYSAHSLLSLKLNPHLSLL